jgi:hypothetical protein
MAHFAEIDWMNNRVTRVIVAEQDFIDSGLVGDPSNWVQTSYNTHGGVHWDPETDEPSADQSKALRKNYAGIGWIYDSDRDAFYEPQPYESWTLNEDTCLWEPPIAYPETGAWLWDEDAYQADNTAGWVENPTSPE